MRILSDETIDTIKFKCHCAFCKYNFIPERNCDRYKCPKCGKHIYAGDCLYPLMES